ncbi:peptidoglycan D,D-transpeptidase FtsI family protein [Methylotetracoccus oryzae]|uniref:peptidoglycan D,D-transpeptidase FtsI family protein n=1 Tax=Methylotetracoccus oryzae TaxID=1919059 RepID=UPI002E25BBD3
MMIYPTSSKRLDDDEYAVRWQVLLFLILAGLLVLMVRASYLQVLNRQFLQNEGDRRHVGVMPIPAHRGRILDRNGELLAISSPVKSVWVNPREFNPTEEQLRLIAGILRLPVTGVRAHVTGQDEGTFAFLRRRTSPELADRVLALGVPGVYADREYQRYYPSGEVAAHVVGFNDIDDRGQEGIELAYDRSLRGVEGGRKIIRDGRRRIIEDLDEVTEPVAGKDVRLTIDQRLQYLAYRELKAAVQKNRAKSGSLVLLDARNGDILAMVNQPSFNPNSRQGLKGNLFRNRAITDLFEPGSTMKPFAVACGLELGLFRPESVINTNPGSLRVGTNVVKDMHNYGVMNVTRILQKSSNVGVSRIALAIPSAKFYAFYNNLGFGQPLHTGFPGEAQGRLPHHRGWNHFEQATLSFGYGLSTSVLHLGRAYLAFANEGRVPSVNLVAQREASKTYQVMSAKTAASVRTMLEQVVTREGTALRAAVPGFRVAGKTGTVKKAMGRRGYASAAHSAVFAGLAPASDPRLVMVVMIDEPSAGEYYGGTVAAPVFSSVMEGALRLLNVVPDEPTSFPLLTAQGD